MLVAKEVFAAMDSLAYAQGRPDLKATLKARFSDFQVDEDLGFEPSGAGDHVFVQLRKTDLSTTDTARHLARISGVSGRDVGYSGMKDRRGECSQWFSIKLPAGGENAFSDLQDERLQLLQLARNHRKLRIGSHRHNRFQLLLRDCEGDAAEFDRRLRALAAQGVPNYFGVQRFGRDLSNLEQVLKLFRDSAGPGSSGNRHKRGMLYSAARAYLFNQVLSRRLEQGNWCQYQPGDVLNLDGSNRCFLVADGDWDEKLQARLQEFDIHLTGPLPGLVGSKDKYISKGIAADIENAVLEKYPELLAGLRQHGLEAGRRPLRFRVHDLQWQWQQDQHLLLQFTLSKGAYATSLLRELCQTDEQG
ncbi:MAG: tRNA pseudouridine(13) synthase TruD [Pseudomonadales bacterium]|nr:tRNA pseudouridine(13) synthase TruD [Pseudomonadales bacterium]